MTYKISYRDIDVMTSYDISCIKKISPCFCTIRPTIINYTMGNESGIILTDGEYSLHFEEDNFKLRFTASEKRKPTDKERELAHREIFDLY